MDAIIYTSISRAWDICITVGQWEALEAAIGRGENKRRITRLAEMIKGTKMKTTLDERRDDLVLPPRPA